MQDVPDYLRMSMSKYTTGWAANNPAVAAAGPLSAFADVYRHRQGLAGSAMPAQAGSTQQPAVQQQQQQQQPVAVEGSPYKNVGDLRQVSMSISALLC
jgi:hypothetical protein